MNEIEFVSSFVVGEDAMVTVTVWSPTDRSLGTSVQWLEMWDPSIQPQPVGASLSRTYAHDPNTSCFGFRLTRTSTNGVPLTEAYIVIFGFAVSSTDGTGGDRDEPDRER